jgi:hypothetical protein
MILFVGEISSLMGFWNELLKKCTNSLTPSLLLFMHSNMSPPEFIVFLPLLDQRFVNARFVCSMNVLIAQTLIRIMFLFLINQI